eukprot:Tbor_TRINITY_DN960_c0_g1::TRINITY_DN960_c0_g1_i1::g.21223::m.21223
MSSPNKRINNPYGPTSTVDANQGYQQSQSQPSSLGTPFNNVIIGHYTNQPAPANHQPNFRYINKQHGHHSHQHHCSSYQSQNYTNTPPHAYGSNLQFRNSPHDHRTGSWNRRGGMNTPNHQGTPNSSHMLGGDQDPVLMPTRPLLKALAKECKPYPPWCVGSPPVNSLSDELVLFGSFLSCTSEEKSKLDHLKRMALKAFRVLWPEADFEEMGITAAGVTSPKECVLHLYATNTETVDSDVETTIRSAANETGFQVDYFRDATEYTCVMLTEAHTGERCVIRFGPNASNSKPCADLLKKTIRDREQYRVVLVAIVALMRQNKTIDDTGLHPSQLSGEALAVMLLCIINSYGDDVPDSGRLLVDFFLTFGFNAHFDSIKHTISPNGIAIPVPKVHLDCQLSILDPSNMEKNLAQKVDKVALLMAVFNYCYTALSQYEQVDQAQCRAQSALSTIIGGETYWSRVLQLYNQKICPIYPVIREKVDVLTQF